MLVTAPDLVPPRLSSTRNSGSPWIEKHSVNINKDKKVKVVPGYFSPPNRLAE